MDQHININERWEQLLRIFSKITPHICYGETNVLKYFGFVLRLFQEEIFINYCIIEQSLPWPRLNPAIARDVIFFKVL